MDMLWGFNRIWEVITWDQGIKIYIVPFTDACSSFAEYISGYFLFQFALCLLFSVLYNETNICASHYPRTNKTLQLSLYLHKN